MARVSSPDFWQDLYERRGDGWELGRPAPPLVNFIETTPPPRGRVAVLGCGRGHDARYLARHGYETVGFDFSAAALHEARALAEREGVTVTFAQHDILALGRDRGATFDGVWEYTCFCAIDPRRRPEYVATLNAILKPGGWLLACFYPIRRGGAGPPFSVARTEVRRLLRSSFRIERAFAPPSSVPRRQGQEWMVLARRIGGP
ncbi:MAG: methyltransferase domain-containing protein [Candidatus Rokuibacteriota bacterium]